MARWGWIVTLPASKSKKRAWVGPRYKVHVSTVTYSAWSASRVPVVTPLSRFLRVATPLITPSFPCGGPAHWPERRLISNLLSLLLLLLLPLLATACWSWRPSALDRP